MLLCRPLLGRAAAAAFTNCRAADQLPSCAAPPPKLHQTSERTPHQQQSAAIRTCCGLSAIHCRAASAKCCVTDLMCTSPTKAIQHRSNNKPMPLSYLVHRTPAAAAPTKCFAADQLCSPPQVHSSTTWLQLCVPAALQRGSSCSSRPAQMGCSSSAWREATQFRLPCRVLISPKQ
jgi:hypothetical protein